MEKNIKDRLGAMEAFLRSMIEEVKHNSGTTFLYNLTRELGLPDFESGRTFAVFSLNFERVEESLKMIHRRVKFLMEDDGGKKPKAF